MEGEYKRKGAQQLPNKDPEPMETRDWGQSYWEGIDWDDWEYYFGPYMPGYGENMPLAKVKGGKPLGGMVEDRQSTNR